MIELFARIEDISLFPGQVILPVHIAEDISSLSAILLDDNYYELMLKGKINISDISVLDKLYINNIQSKSISRFIKT